MAERWGTIEAIRARELQRVFAHRYGHRLPDDDAGRDDMRLMLSQLARVAHPVQRMSNFLDLYCPWLPSGEREMLVQEAMTTPPERRTADDIADRIGIDFHTRTQLRVTTIGATDVRKDDRKRLRAARRAERERRRRTLKRKATKANGTAAARAGRTPAVRCALSNTTEWQSTGDVADTVAGWGAFRGLKGKSLTRAVSRALDHLKVVGEVEERRIQGRTGLPCRMVKLVV